MRIISSNRRTCSWIFWPMIEHMGFTLKSSDQQSGCQAS
jgi:hypothetical protein